MSDANASVSAASPPLSGELAFHLETFTAELFRETDRGVALVIASHLDELLKHAVQKRLAVVDRHVAPLFNTQGPLGSFNVKIALGYGFGIYGPGVRSDLEKINSIRREYAHRLFHTDKAGRRTVFALDVVPFRDICASLVTPEKHVAYLIARCVSGKTLELSAPRTDPRGRLIQTAVTLSIGLLGIIDDLLVWEGPDGPYPRDKPHPYLGY